VMQLVVQGKSNREIDYTLRIAEHTVEKHMASVFRKLIVNNRTSAALAFLVQTPHTGNPP
jgi:DNA-binding CsgD family transcriptional regulator